MFVQMFMLKRGDKGERLAPQKRSERSLNFLKLLFPCPQKWHEQSEQREQRFKIKDLRREQRPNLVRTIRTRLKSIT